MSLIAVVLNLVLGGLLVAALLMGMRLDRKLKALRDSHEGFAKAVSDLDAAALRAEQGLADLRAATDEAAETLGERIDRARALVSKLDERSARVSTLQERLETVDRPQHPADRVNERLERLARLVDAQPAGAGPSRPHLAAVESIVERAQAAQRSRAAVDDDLFEGVPLQALAGGRR